MWKLQKHKEFDIGDFALNKSGTIGVEPIAKYKNGQERLYSEIKLGKLGSIDIPRRKPKK